MISVRKRSYYQDLITNPLFSVQEDGTILRQANSGNEFEEKWVKQSLYFKENRYYFKYLQVELAVHIAVLAKYERIPEDTEFVIHRDDNVAHNHLDNLKIIPKKGNTGTRLKPGDSLMLLLSKKSQKQLKKMMADFFEYEDDGDYYVQQILQGKNSFEVWDALGCDDFGYRQKNPELEKLYQHLGSKINSSDFISR